MRRIALLGLLVASANVFAQLAPWIDLVDGWIHSETGQPVRLQQGRLAFNPAGQYYLTRTVTLPPGTDTANLAITLGVIHGAYRLSVNGVSLGETPDYARRFEPMASSRVFPLAPGLIQPGQPAEIRLDISSQERTQVRRYQRFVLTGREAAGAVAAADVSEVRLARVSLVFLFGLAVMLSGIILAAAYRSPHFGAAAWLAAWLLAETTNRAIAGISVFTPVLGFGTMLLLQGVLSVVVPACLGEFLARMLPVPPRWRFWAYPLMVAGFWWRGLEWAPIVILALRHLRDRRTWALTISAVLAAAIGFSVRQGWLGLLFYWGPLGFPYTGIVPVLFGAILILTLARRLLDDRLKKERLSEELLAAATVQQLMLPSATAESGGWSAEAVYEPALEVGGDFYWSQVEEDGALTVAVGDVSGKGLRAAMLAAFCTGVLRHARGARPAQLLSDLNEALAARASGGFVTCCCARFDLSGRVTVASAGHPAPFVDSVELVLESGLPLGILPGASYSETATQGRGVTFLSDGVIEAENAARELFGFHRTREISTRPATEIAAAARQWGQNDDITVVTVRRTQ